MSKKSQNVFDTFWVFFQRVSWNWSCNNSDFVFIRELQQESNNSIGLRLLRHWRVFYLSAGQLLAVKPLAWPPWRSSCPPWRPHCPHPQCQCPRCGWRRQSCRRPPRTVARRRWAAAIPPPAGLRPVAFPLAGTASLGFDSGGCVGSAGNSEKGSSRE